MSIGAQVLFGVGIDGYRSERKSTFSPMLQRWPVSTNTECITPIGWCRVACDLAGVAALVFPMALFDFLRARLFAVAKRA